MRILLANKFLFPKGGAERSVLTLGHELVRRGHKVAWFGMDHPDNVISSPDSEWVTRRDYHEGGRRRLGDAVAMLYSFEARALFCRLVDRFRPDVVHVHNIYHQLTPSILDAARARRVPVIMTVHDYKLVCPRYDMLRHGRLCDTCIDDGPVACVRHRCAGSLASSLLLACESALHRVRGSYDTVRLLVAPSAFMRRVLLRAGFEAARVRHVANFAPPVPAPEHPVEPQPDHFVFVGRLSAEKGIETLLQAVLKLGHGHLTVCGAGPLRDRLQALTDGAPGCRIEWRGHLDNQAVATAVRSASFVVVPSEWFENAPFAVLESMALGRAVLASDLGGLPELVQDGVTGQLVRAGEVEAWSRAIAAALDAPERMQRYGRAGRDIAVARHGLEAHVEATLALYREVGA